MIPPITPDTERLRSIAERAKNATEGPWIPEYGYCEPADGCPYLTAADENPVASCDGCPVIKPHNVDFIAHSRQDIPFLLQTIQALQEENEKCKHWQVKESKLRNRIQQLEAALEKAREIAQVIVNQGSSDPNAHSRVDACAAMAMIIVRDINAILPQSKDDK